MTAASGGQSGWGSPAQMGERMRQAAGRFDVALRERGLMPTLMYVSRWDLNGIAANSARDQFGFLRQVHGREVVDVFRADQIFASEETGSWTMVSTTANGTSCIVAVGEAWQVLPTGPMAEILAHPKAHPRG